MNGPSFCGGGRAEWCHFVADFGIAMFWCSSIPLAGQQDRHVPQYLHSSTVQSITRSGVTPDSTDAPPAL